MPVRLSTADRDFEAGFSQLLSLERDVSDDVDRTVAAIIADVRNRGDAALHDYTLRFDHVDLSELGLLIGTAEVDRAVDSIDEETRSALRFAHDRIELYHRRQLPQGVSFTDGLGVQLGSRWTAVSSAGLYVPGGTAAYPSSVLMNAVPARVAGVERLVMVVPTPGGVANPLVLAAARLVGIDEIYRIGGAQAIAALAFGTKTIASVAKVVGPGNAYVAAAKRQVFGRVGIDMIAGPSEVLIIADGENDPDWIAADLLAQAEHDTAAQSILMTDDGRFADAVEGAVEQQVRTLPRFEIAAESWRRHGAVIVVRDLEAEAPVLCDLLAPEHVQIATARPERLADRIRNAGAIFLGRHTPEAIGDYVAGPNHVLPTARSARFSSGLGVLDFMKRTSLLRTGREELQGLAPAAVALARAEGLEGHARSVSIRLER